MGLCITYQFYIISSIYYCLSLGCVRMKGVNHLKVFGIIVLIFMTLITVGYTMHNETLNPLPERVIKDGMSVVQTVYPV